MFSVKPVSPPPPSLSRSPTERVSLREQLSSKSEADATNHASTPSPTLRYSHSTRTHICMHVLTDPFLSTIRWASESQVSRVARRVSVDLHLTLSKLKAISLLAPSPRLDGTEPVANRDVHSSKWRKALNIGHKGAAG